MIDAGLAQGHCQRIDAVGPVHHLHPGDVGCGGRGERFETLLGSCVAIILTDPRRTVGTMCHIVHAAPALGAQDDNTAHADAALASMYRLLRGRGIEPRLCEAYVYGGGNMFPALVRGRHVGDNNARWALEALAQDGLAVVGHDVGGQVYRRLGWTVGPRAPQVTTVDV